MRTRAGAFENGRLGAPNLTLMTPHVIIDSIHGLGTALSRVLQREGERALRERGRFGVALPGGSVATTLFPLIAREARFLSKAHFFWGDERAVPADDPESNYAAARPLLLDPLGVPPDRVHRMEAERDDLAAAASAYADEMTRVLDGGGLDVVLVGVGPDGHVCSLFPGHALLDERTLPVAPVFDSPKPPARRLTLTRPALEAAGLVVVAAMGASKARAVAAALDDDASELPVALVKRGAQRALFLLDPQAASGAHSIASNAQNGRTS